MRGIAPCNRKTETMPEKYRGRLFKGNRLLTQRESCFDMNVEAFLYKPSPFGAIWSHIGIPKQVHCSNSHKLKKFGINTINK